MLCQKCGKKEATTYVKTVVDGFLSEHALCADCAANYNHLLPAFDMSNFFKSFFGENVPEQKRCPACGASLQEIISSGKVGCSQCYSVFYDKLMPSIQRIHGTALHKGKVPGKAAQLVPQVKAEMTVPKPLDQKRALLNKAIQEQRFEDAAVIRDEIKRLEAAQ